MRINRDQFRFTSLEQRSGSKKELEELRDENRKLREAQRRCAECENFDRRRDFGDEKPEDEA